MGEVLGGMADAETKKGASPFRVVLKEELGMIAQSIT